MRVLERSYLVRFEPEARATEPPCSSSQAEMVRKTRIGAGGWQSLALTRAIMHPRYGLRAFAFWGHKILRWCVPILLLLVLVANLFLMNDRLYVGLLAGQVIGMLFASAAYLSRGEIRLPRWTRPMSYFYLMNWALLCGFIRFLLKTQRVTWDRATPSMMTETVLSDPHLAVVTMRQPVLSIESTQQD